MMKGKYLGTFDTAEAAAHYFAEKYVAMHGTPAAVVEEDSSQILGTEAISGAQRDKDGDLIFTVFDQSVQTPAYVSLPHR